MKSGIYQITCLINGKSYIGSAINLKKRWNYHKEDLNKNKHRNKRLQNAWNKYGEEYFEFYIREYCEKNILIEKEQYYIDSIEPEFNICKIAGSQLGYRHTEETKKKIKLNRKKQIYSKETLKKFSERLTGNIYAKGKTFLCYRKRRFSDEDIHDIRISKLSSCKLAKEYSCTHSTILQIKNKKTYRDVK